MKATRDGYGEALAELGGKNPNVVALDADLSCSTRTKLFADKFPDRFFNAGVAEANMIGMAAGLALSGKVAFASTFAVFATNRCFDQIRVSVAYPALDVKIAASHSGITVGEDGASHQALEDIALMRSLPNMKVVVPADAIEAGKAVFAIAGSPGPFYLRLGRPKVPLLEGQEFTLGKANVLRDGSDVALIACGYMVHEALEAAELLKSKGVSARVINMHTVKPLDEKAILKAAKETGRIVTCEEHSRIGGLGSAVASILSEKRPTPMRIVGTDDTFGESGLPAELIKKYGLSGAHIAKAAKELLK
ncbi:MAG: transketolase family protein [Candidatus Eisenbacteria sp.]|nr:transketolase family protein [Candidatus Eisenbacteria bacterium]